MATSQIKKYLVQGKKLSRPCMKNDYIYLKGCTVYLASTQKSYNPGVIGCEYFQWEKTTDWFVLN